MSKSKQVMLIRNRLAKSFEVAKRYHQGISLDKSFQSVFASCGRLPSVNVETFSKVTRNYKESDFGDPKILGPQNRNEAVKFMMSKGTFTPSIGLLRTATDDALQLMGLRQHMFVPTDLRTAIGSLPTNTSTGAFYFSAPKGEYTALVFNACMQILKSGEINRLAEQTIAVVAWRTQQRLTGTKFRQIFVLNYTFNTFEAMFAHPILEYYRKNKNTAYSFDSVWLDNKEVWKKLQSYGSSLAFDYSKFDLSMSQEMVNYTFYVIKRLFKFTPDLSELFDQIIHVHTTCPIYTQYNNKPIVFDKKSGVLSGSVFTNFLDTLMNAIMLSYTLRVMGLDPHKEFIKLKGDDIIMSNSQNINTDRFRTIMKRTFGATIAKTSVKKFKKGQMIEFLGYKFDNKKKLAFSDKLLHDKIAVSGRFIKEEDMPEPIRVISKIVSVLSNVTNGYTIFKEQYLEQYLQFYGITQLPKYYYDLAETETQSYALDRVKNVWHELRYGWMYR